jgi:hypothetical protein
LLNFRSVAHHFTYTIGELGHWKADVCYSNNDGKQRVHHVRRYHDDEAVPDCALDGGVRVDAVGTRLARRPWSPGRTRVILRQRSACRLWQWVWNQLHTATELSQKITIATVGNQLLVSWRHFLGSSRVVLCVTCLTPSLLVRICICLYSEYSVKTILAVQQL